MIDQKQLFLGILTSDWAKAKHECENLIEHRLKCSVGLFYGGEHCDASINGDSYSLRLNYHDDGWGDSWCVKDPKYRFVFSCSGNADAIDRILNRLAKFPLLELPSPDGQS